MTERNCSQDWVNVRGFEFTHEEARDAADFNDVVSFFCVQPEMLIDFVNDQKLLVGHRLYLVENLPVDDLGPVLMGEGDDRVCAIAKIRCDEANRGDGVLWLPE